MGKLLYFDGKIAVCDFEIGQRADERAVKLLLEVDSGNPDVEKHVKPLLECWNVPVKIGYSPLSDGKPATFEDIDPAAFGEQIRKVAEEDEKRPYELTASRNFRVDISVPDSIRRIRSLAACLQYLAKLHLLANGDKRHDSLLPDVNLGEHALEFETVIPGGFADNLTALSLPTPARFEVLDSPDINGSDCLTVATSIYYPNAYLLPDDGFELKRIAASYMLSGLVDYQCAAPYSSDPDTLALKRNDAESFASVLADLIIDGKISACPWCGRPMLLPRKSSKPFCRQSHQTRYSEKARAMLNGGASVNEVSEAFPHIQYATIRGWLPMEGR